MAVKYRGKYKHRGAFHPKIFVWSHTEKAEIEYFQEFKDYLGTHLLMPKKMRNNKCLTPQKLLDEVVKWKKEQIHTEDNDQVWCIFDVDDFYKNINDKRDFLRAIKNAVENGVKIAYVNECFELWILLHFEKPVSAGLRGRDIERKIQNAFKQNGLGVFKKNQKIFQTLLPFQAKAIKNAQGLLLTGYSKIVWEKALSTKGNPSTSIHILVEEINRLFGNGKK